MVWYTSSLEKGVKFLARYGEGKITFSSEIGRGSQEA